MCDIGDRLICALSEQFSAGYGDPETAVSGDVALVSTRWDSILAAVRPSTVVLVNLSTTLEVQWTASDTTAKNPAAIGGRIQPGQPLTLDGFRGRIYCRTTSGAATVNFSVLPRF